MNLKRAVYHVKHPVVDKVTPWFAYAGYLHEKGTGKITMNLENYVMDALSSFYDGEGNPLLMAVTDVRYCTDISKLSTKVLGD